VGSRGAQRGWVWGGSVPSPLLEGSGKRTRVLPDFLLLVLKMEHFVTVFKLDLTEETRRILPLLAYTGYACG